MADVKAVDERAEMPEKRKLDLTIPVEKSTGESKEESDSSKRPKLDVPAEKNGSASPAAGGNVAEPKENSGNIPAAEEEEEENDEDEDDYTAETVDRKGKAAVIDQKGKGKMIEDSEDDEDEDDDSSDDSDSGFSDGLDVSDLEDDPLAEVDLDNILPSRTRGGQAQPGFRISGDSGKDV